MVLTPRDAGAPVEASVDVLFGVCNDVCIPAQARLTAHLDATAPAAPENRAEIERALASRPVDLRGRRRDRGALRGQPRRYRADGDGGGHLRRAPGPGLTTVIEAAARPDLWIGPAETETDGRNVRATARVESSGGGLALDRRGLRLTLLDARRAIDIRGCAARD